MWKYYVIMFGIIAFALTFGVFYVRGNVPVQLESEDRETLQRTIEETLTAIMQGIEIPPEEDRQMKNKLESINLHHCAENDRVVRFFKNMRKKAIPGIEVGLRSEKVEIRQKSLIALTYLLRPPELRDKDDKSAEDFLSLVLIRSLKDKEPMIRQHATSILGGIAYYSGWPGPKPDPAPLVTEALNAMLSDADSLVRETAATQLIRIGREMDVPEELRERLKGVIID